VLRNLADDANLVFHLGGVIVKQAKTLKNDEAQ
jgi:hypothetical protein